MNTNSRFDFSGLLVVNYNLEQFSIQRSSVDIPATFMQSISAPGGLVQVVLDRVRSVTGDGVTALIGNSPNLMTYHVSADYIYAYPGVLLKLKIFNTTLKKKFSNRKLFSSGSYHLDTSECYLTVCDTELSSIWYECSDIKFL